MEMTEASVGRRRTLRGRSGVLHVFSEVVRNPGAEKVVEAFGREVTEVEIVGLYAKMIDVGVRRAEVVAPSWTGRARDLAEEYGITLRQTTR